MAENRVGMSMLWCATMMTLPSPRSPVNHSPTTAPMTESGTAILNAAKTYGSALATRSFKRTCASLALSSRKKSNVVGLTDLSPMKVLTITGKKVMKSGDHHLGERTEPEPDDEERRYCDDGRDLDKQGDWIDRSLEQPRVGHHARRDHGDQGSHSEAAKRFYQCD